MILRRLYDLLEEQPAIRTLMEYPRTLAPVKQPPSQSKRSGGITIQWKLRSRNTATCLFPHQGANQKAAAAARSKRNIPLFSGRPVHPNINNIHTNAGVDLYR